MLHFWIVCFAGYSSYYSGLQVTASAWINDLRNQIEQTRILSTVYRSASALGSRLPSIAAAREKVAGAGAILRPVSNGTQVLIFYKIDSLCFVEPVYGGYSKILSVKTNLVYC